MCGNNPGSSVGPEKAMPLRFGIVLGFARHYLASMTYHNECNSEFGENRGSRKEKPESIHVVDKYEVARLRLEDPSSR